MRGCLPSDRWVLKFIGVVLLGHDDDVPCYQLLWVSVVFVWLVWCWVNFFVVFIFVRVRFMCVVGASVALWWV